MQLFGEIRQEITAAHSRLLTIGDALAEIDTAAALAETAIKNRFCRPTIDDTGELEITGARHPVLEQIIPLESMYRTTISFIGETRVLLITGPNMAGKSTYLRTIGLNILLAQLGSFIAADSGRIGIVDRLFTRIGASDHLALGESTFLVEMNEASYLLNNATSRSVILLMKSGEEHLLSTGWRLHGRWSSG